MESENNVAAQDGDEPMRAAFEVWAWQECWTRAEIMETRTAEGYSLLSLNDAWSVWKAATLAAQVSPRATADVEREEKRQDKRVERLVRAAKVYTFNYLQDEHEEAELCTCGPKQHAELVELFAALAAIATTKPGA